MTDALVLEAILATTARSRQLEAAGSGKRLGNNSSGREEVQDVSGDNHPREQPEPLAARVRIRNGNRR